MSKGTALKGFFHPLLDALLRQVDEVAVKNMDEAAARLGKQVDGDLLTKNKFTARPGKALRERMEKHPKLKAEYERQVRLQEKGLNSRSVDDFIKGDTRTGKAQDEMRKDFDAKLQELVDDGSMTGDEMKAIQDDLAALHNPDLRGGGADATDFMSMGERSVNSSLGSNWRRQGAQVDALREELRELVAQKKIDPKQRMNVTLQAEF